MVLCVVWDGGGRDPEEVEDVEEDVGNMCGG